MGSNRRNAKKVLMSLGSAPKAIKNTLLIMFETRSGTMVCVSSLATRKTAPTRAHGNGDVSEEDFQRQLKMPSYVTLSGSSPS